MSVRTQFLASVCSAFLAASAAVSGAAAATTQNQLVSQAYKALQVGDAASAVTAYSKAIESRKLEPEVLANALLNRGLAYQRLNEHEFAIDDYTAAMRVDAMSGNLRALALYNRGLSYQRLQRNAEAIEDFTSALFLDSQFSHAYYSRGTLLRDGGQHLFALADFDKALRFNYPDPARVYFAESLTYEKLKRTGDARNALNKALDANPKYEPAVQRLAVLEGRRQPILALAAASDQMATAAVTPAKPKLPEASAPSAELMGETPDVTVAEASAKKFTDRVPPEAETQRVAKIVAASAAPDEGEKILAVETVPEEPADEAAAPAEAVSETAAAPRITGWAVQLASASTEDAAWSVWKKMKVRNKALASKEPVVVRADLGTKGIFYRVRLVGFDSQNAANSECSKLKSKGVRCYISKAAS
ncbi:SPOR domain-containing protein [Aestuariivirga sp.]|uniref:SPOR domain-containing protein n=1 Tax=Aestuariivirga sp. TaxID=2650926 RepID=UPI003594460E